MSSICKYNLNLMKNVYRSINTRRYSSTLFLTGERATRTCAVVTPQLDMLEILNNTEQLKTNLALRNISINIEGLTDIWSFFSVIDQTRKQLELKKNLLSETYAELKSEDKSTESDLDKLLIQSRILKENIRDLKAVLRPIEENLMLSILSLPNVLHSKTPENEKVGIETYKEKPSIECEKSHIDIGTSVDILYYLGPYSYFLKDNAALFELSAKFYFNERLRDMGYIQFSNPDFVKSAVIEGCGYDHMNPDEIFILSENEDTTNEMRLHLTGGGSLFAFAAYHARNVVPHTLFPLKYFSMGRQYRPVPENNKMGLFQVSQSSVVEIFVAVKDDEEKLNLEVEKVLFDVTEIYKKLGYHFKTCYCPVNDLLRWESMRITFEMYSPFLKKYIDVGRISVSDDFISRRLQFCYKDGIYRFPKIISGTILDVPRILGCVIESDPHNVLQLPDCLKNVF